MISRGTEVNLLKFTQYLRQNLKFGDDALFKLQLLFANQKKFHANIQ